MKRTIRLVALAVSLLMLAGLALGCTPTSPSPDPGGATNPPAGGATNPPAAGGSDSTERVTVEFWHTAKGDEIERTDATIALFNESQDQYTVIGTSVPEVARVITAMSSGQGPDVMTVLGENTIPFAAQGMITPIDEFVERDNLDLSEFPSSTLIAGTAGGQRYGLPQALTIIGLFYNKDLLAKHGYDETMLPKTFEEMYDIGVATTEVDANGDITVLGFPIVPFKAYYMEGTYAFGGDFRPAGGTGPVNIPEEAIRTALEFNMKFREEFGADAVNRWASEKQAARYTEQDAFIRGEQVFRMDGYWMVNYFSQFGAEDLNYGIMPIPGGNGAANGRTRLENGYYCISALSSDEVKQGAWEFVKFMTMGAGAEKALEEGNAIPASTRLAQLPFLADKEGMKEFTDIVAMDQMIPLPVFARSSELITAINECFDYVYNGTKTIDQAIADLKSFAGDMVVTEDPALPEE